MLVQAGVRIDDFPLMQIASGWPTMAEQLGIASAARFAIMTATYLGEYE